MTLDPCQEDLHPKLSILAEQAGPDLLKGFKVLLLESKFNLIVWMSMVVRSQLTYPRRYTPSCPGFLYEVGG